MMEGLAIFMTYALAVIIPFLAIVALYYMGVSALYLVYRHNGGKYNLIDYIYKKGLDL